MKTLLALTTQIADQEGVSPLTDTKGRDRATEAKGPSTLPTHHAPKYKWSMKLVEVFADVACPFTHVGLRRFAAYRGQRGRTEPLLRVRAWPLELVNEKALDGPSLVAKIEALRADVAPDLFVSFDQDRFPATTLPAMAAEAAAYRQWADLTEGQARGVAGSPHFLTADGNFFCPSLRIDHDGDGYAVSFDPIGFQRFVSAAFAELGRRIRPLRPQALASER